MSLTILMNETRSSGAGVYAKGSQYTIDDGLARMFIHHGYAELVSGKLVSNDATPASVKSDTNSNALGIDNGNGGIIGGIVNVTGNRVTTIADNGVTLVNASASNYTITIEANTIAQATMIQQESAGTITIAAGAGVTFIGTSLATSGAGSKLIIRPTATANNYIIDAGTGGGAGIPQVNFLKPLTLGFAGDSIAVMWASTASGDSPITHVKTKLYPCDVKKIFSSAVGGTSSSHLISTQIAQLEALTVKPDIMVVQSLQNDSMSTIGGADVFLTYMTSYATRALAAGVKLVCLCSRPPKSESASGVPDAITYINRKLEQFCATTEGCYYVDVFNAWRNWNNAEATTRINYRNTASTSTAYSDDGTHPLPRAMQAVASLFEPVLRRYARPIYPTSMSFNAYNNTTALWNNILGANGLFVGTTGQLNGVDHAGVAGTGATAATRWQITTANGVTVTPSIVVGLDGSNYQQIVLGGTASADTNVTIFITPATNIVKGDFYFEGLVETTSVTGVKSIGLQALNGAVSLAGSSNTVSEIDVGTGTYHFRSEPFNIEVTNFAGFSAGLAIAIENGVSPTGTIKLGRVGAYRISIT